jgi:hypothetical protein
MVLNLSMCGLFLAGRPQNPGLYIFLVIKNLRRFKSQLMQKATLATKFTNRKASNKKIILTFQFMGSFATLSPLTFFPCV